MYQLQIQNDAGFSVIRLCGSSFRIRDCSLSQHPPDYAQNGNRVSTKRIDEQTAEIKAVVKFQNEESIFEEEI